MPMIEKVPSHKKIERRDSKCQAFNPDKESDDSEKQGIKRDNTRKASKQLIISSKQSMDMLSRKLVQAITMTETSERVLAEVDDLCVSLSKEISHWCSLKEIENINKAITQSYAKYVMDIGHNLSKLFNENQINALFYNDKIFDLLSIIYFSEGY